MQNLTVEQRLQIVELYYQNDCSTVRTHRALRKIYGPHKRPNERTIRRLIEKFRTTYTVQDSKPTTRRRNVRTNENIAAVQKSYAEDPNMTIRRRSQQLGLCPSTIWKILNKDLNLKKEPASDEDNEVSKPIVSSGMVSNSETNEETNAPVVITASTKLVETTPTMNPSNISTALPISRKRRANSEPVVGPPSKQEEVIIGDHTLQIIKKKQ